MEYRLSRAPMKGDLKDFPDQIALINVDETKWEALWDKLVQDHHYLGYDSVIGSRVKYLIALGERVVGAISYCSAAYKLGPRDAYVGWDEEARLSMLPGLVCNNRFLILPWVKIKNLASKILSLSLKRMRQDWERQYGTEPLMVETFVDGSMFSGTCYAADNWVRLGETKGFGRQKNAFVFHGRTKDIYVKILSPKLKRLFNPDMDRLPNEKKDLLGIIRESPTYYPSILKESAIGDLALVDIEELLAEHLLRYTPYLNRSELPRHLVVLMKGFLSDIGRKSVEPVAASFGSPGAYQNIANFLRMSKWDNEGMLKEYQDELFELLSDPFGMITFDGCDFSKKGKMSPGVARQPCGPFGRMDNCQTSVMAGFSGKNGAGVADYELFMPEIWFREDFEEKRGKCCVPESLEFKTKSELASLMIRRLLDSGRFMGKYVGVGASLTRDQGFLETLPKDLVYFAEIPQNFHVFEKRPEMVAPAYAGRGRKPKAVPSHKSMPANQIFAGEAAPWSPVILGPGPDGPITALDKAMRVVVAKGEEAGKDIWLYAIKPERGECGYYLCNEAPGASLEDIRKPALLRWSIERCFKESKERLGLSHCEARSYQGWRRHVLLTFISHLFITKLRLQFGEASEPSLREDAKASRAASRREARNVFQGAPQEDALREDLPAASPAASQEASKKAPRETSQKASRGAKQKGHEQKGPLKGHLEAHLEAPASQMDKPPKANDYDKAV